jgi:hypothetical protein
MQCLAHPLGSDSSIRQRFQEIKLQISRIRATRQGSRAVELEKLDAAACHQDAPPSSDWWWPDDAKLVIRTKREPMHRQGVPRHGVTERKLVREDTKEGVHKRSRKLKRGRGGEIMEREQRRGLRCTGRPEPRRRPRPETLSKAGPGARAYVP